MGNRGRAVVASVVVGVLLPLLPSPPASAGPGDLDTAFGGGDGRVSFDSGAGAIDIAPRKMVVQSDGQTLVHGWYFDESFQQRHVIVRVRADGVPDTSWHGGTPIEVVGANDDPVGIDVDSADRLLVRQASKLSRYTTTGALDTTFGGDGIVDLKTDLPATASARITDVQPLSTGRVRALVSRTRTGRVQSAAIVALTATGSLDGSFSGDGVSDLPAPDDVPSGPVNNSYDLEVDANGDLLALVGTGAIDHQVAKVSAAGVLVVGFGSGGLATLDGDQDEGTDLVLDTAGRPVIVHPFESQIDLRRLTTTGAVDGAYGTGGLATIATEHAQRITEMRTIGDVAYALSFESSPLDEITLLVLAIDLAAPGLVSTFGPGGTDGNGIWTVPGISTNTLPGALAVTAGGGIRVSFDDQASELSEIVQITATAALDPAYAGDGRSAVGLPFHASAEANVLRSTPDGGYVVAAPINTTLEQSRIGSGGFYLAKVSATGVPVAAFGGDGRVDFPPTLGQQSVFPRDVQPLSDGRVAVLYNRSSPTTDDLTSLTVLTPAGLPDPTFGGDGTIDVGIRNPSGFALAATAITQAGSGGTAALHVAGVVEDFPPTAAPDLFVQRIPFTGTIDQAYGAGDGSNNGWVGVSFPAQNGLVNDRLIAGAPDGTVIWSGSTTIAGSGSGLVLGKLLASGAADGTFGVGGRRVVPGGATGTVQSQLHLRRRADGGADLLGERISPASVVAIRVSATGALDTGYSGDGIAVLATGSSGRLQGATMQGDQATFLQNLASSTKLIRLTATGTPDTGLGPGGIRTTDYVPTLPQGFPTLLAGDATGVVAASTIVPAEPSAPPGADVELVKLSTSASAPSAPTLVSAARGDGLATVSWSPPVSDGGAVITAYTVVAAPGGAGCSTAGTVTGCVVSGLTNGLPYTFTVTATNAVGTSVASEASAAVTPADGAGAFVPLPSPKRIVDSRSPAGDTDDELQERFGAIPGGTTRTVPVAGRVGLPVGVENVVLTVAAVAPGANGYFTLYPCGTPKPLASSMNFTKGVTLANTVITKLAPTGTVCVYTNVTANIVIDVSGSLTPAAFAALPSPQRIVDSRNPAGDTDDEQQERFGAIPGGTTRTIPVAGRVGLAPDVENVVLTVAAVAPGANGYFTLYPCGTPKPLASSMNFTKGVTLANTVITKLAPTGTVCVYTNVTANIVIDVSGSLW